MDQVETWHAGRPRPWPHCVGWGPSCPSSKGAQLTAKFSTHICCGQMAGWIKMPLDREVGLSPSDIVLDGNQFPLQKGGKASPQFSAHVYCGESWMNQDPTWYGGRPRLRPHCARQGPSSPRPQKGHSSPNFRPMCIVVKWLDGSRCHLVSWR